METMESTVIKKSGDEPGGPWGKANRKCPSMLLELVIEENPWASHQGKSRGQKHFCKPGRLLGRGESRLKGSYREYFRVCFWLFR